MTRGARRTRHAEERGLRVAGSRVLLAASSHVQCLQMQQEISGKLPRVRARLGCGKGEDERMVTKTPRRPGWTGAGLQAFQEGLVRKRKQRVCESAWIMTTIAPGTGWQTAKGMVYHSWQRQGRAEVLPLPITGSHSNCDRYHDVRPRPLHLSAPLRSRELVMPHSYGALPVDPEPARSRTFLLAAAVTCCAGAAALAIVGSSLPSGGSGADVVRGGEVGLLMGGRMLASGGEAGRPFHPERQWTDYASYKEKSALKDLLYREKVQRNKLANIQGLDV